MTEERKDLLARVLDMNEIEMRAALIGIVESTYNLTLSLSMKEAIHSCIDAAYNPIRRTGIPKEVLGKL